MHSTFTSNFTSKNQEPILEVEKLNLVFRTSIYRSWTWRDAFTRIARNPLTWAHAESERLQVSKNISFKLYPGDRVALVGVNGTGKTSLCRCIAGFYTPTQGTVRLRGQVRPIFDTALGIYPELTGRENLKLLAHLLFPQEKDIEAICKDAMEFSELGSFLDVPFRMYSNGMQARLCLSLVSARPADLLILDEVFDGADQFFREKISQRILSMIEKSGAVIFVSHSANQIEKVCNRLIYLKHGQVAYDGPVAQGLDHYTNSYANSCANSAIASI